MAACAERHAVCGSYGGRTAQPEHSSDAATMKDAILTRVTMTIMRRVVNFGETCSPDCAFHVAPRAKKTAHRATRFSSRNRLKWTSPRLVSAP